jgi:uncharacterized protein YdcH (DUF465 family)
MSDSQHDLIHEFPEYREKIQELKSADAHFRKLFDRYHAINKEVMGAEHRTQLMSEMEEETLRKERLSVKDQIYAILKGA